MAEKDFVPAPVQPMIDLHRFNFNNPHQVTAAQVGAATPSDIDDLQDQIDDIIAGGGGGTGGGGSSFFDY